MKMPTNKVNTKQVIYVTTLQLKKKNHTKVCNLEEIKPAHKSNNLALKIQKKTKSNILVIIVSKMYIVELKLTRREEKENIKPKKVTLYIVAVVIENVLI